MFPAYAAAPAGLQVDTQMEEKTRRLWSNDSLYLFLCCPHVWEQSTYVARLGFRYSQCHGCFLKNLMCWVPFVCVFQNTQNIRGLCVISAEITLNPKRTQSFYFFRFLDHRNVHEHFHLKTLWLNQTFPQLITTTSVQFSVFVTLKGSWDLFVALMTDSLSDIWVMFWLVTSVHLNLYLHFLALLKETPFKTTNPVVFVIIYRQTWE